MKNQSFEMCGTKHVFVEGGNEGLCSKCGHIPDADCHIESKISEIEKTLREHFPYGHEDYIPITIAELELHSTKNHDYTKGGDALGNFNRVAKFFESYPNLKLSDPRIVCIAYLMKQLDAALWMINNAYEGSVENIGTRMTDVYVYAKIAKILDLEMKRCQAKELLKNDLQKNS